MKTKKLRFLALLLSVLLMASMLPPSTFADEPADELTQETIDRVYDEVLSGEITSTEDVLRVALAQYEIQNINTAFARNISGQPASDPDAPVTFYQTVNVPTGVDGETQEALAITGLLIVDENGRSVTANDFIYYSGTVTDKMDNYEIYASHTMYVIESPTNPNDSSDRTQYVCVHSVKTVITNGTTVPLTKLVQRYADCKYPVAVVEGDSAYCERTVNNPTSGTYTYYPPERRYIQRGITYGSFIQTSATIYSSLGELSVCITQPLGGERWDLVEGW